MKVLIDECIILDIPLLTPDGLQFNGDYGSGDLDDIITLTVSNEIYGDNLSFYRVNEVNSLSRTILLIMIEMLIHLISSLERKVVK